VPHPTFLLAKKNQEQNSQRHCKESDSQPKTELGQKPSCKGTKQKQKREKA
jgi:hypothetical protein